MKQQVVSAIAYSVLRQCNTAGWTRCQLVYRLSIRHHTDSDSADIKSVFYKPWPMGQISLSDGFQLADETPAKNW